MASESELVKRARTGDWNAFEQLISRYERRAFAVAQRIVLNRQDAEEVVQESLLSVVEHLSGFREEASFYTWLMRIVVNNALKVRRQRKPTISLAEESRDESYAGIEPPGFIAPWNETPDQIAEKREAQALIQDALAGLDEKYQAVFVLRDIEGLSTEETAEILDISLNNVKVRLLRARLMLREKLTRAFGDESRAVASENRHAH